MLQNLITGIQGIVDHTMVGHYVGYTGNAAIGVSWQIFLVVVVFVSSLYAGMGILVARFVGAGDPRKVARVVYQAFLTAVLLIAVFFAPIGFFLTPKLLSMVNAVPEVQVEAVNYLRLLFVFSFGIMIFFMLGGALRAAGDAKTPLRLGLMMTVLNIILNVIFIPGLGPIPAMGTAGAALGSVTAATIVGLYGLYLLFTGRLVIRLTRDMSFKPDWRIIGLLLRFGMPTGLQGVVMNLGGIFLIRFVGSLQHSAEAQAAYTVGYVELFAVVTWTALSLLNATSVITGQSLGAGNLERARRVPRVAATMGVVLVGFLGILFLTIPRLLFAAFGMENEEAVRLGVELLAYLSVSGLFLTTALSYTGALQGSGDTRSPLYISIVSQLVIPLGYCAVVQAYYGLTSTDIWTAIVVGHLIRCLLSVARFHQEKWTAIKVDLQET